MIHQPSKFTRAATALALGASLLLPSLAFAEDSVRLNGDARVKVDVGGGANFCSNLATLGTAITNRIPKREDKRDEHMDDRITKVDNRFQLRLTNLDDHRGEWDQNREDRYAKLDVRATTTAEVTALATFKTNVNAAVTVRRAAVDAAIKTFQDGVNALLATRQSSVDAAFTTLKTSTDAAIAKAKTSCTNGTDPKTVRATLAADIKAANTAFQAATKPSGDLETKVKALRTTRDAAVKAAVTTFEATVKSELAKLKLAFGVK